VWWWFDNPQQPQQFLIIYEINLTGVDEELGKMSEIKIDNPLAENNMTLKNSS
jgi:hypothetical protein